MRVQFASRNDLEAYLRTMFPDAEGGLSPLRGGAAAANRVLEAFDAGKYAATRNFLNGTVSRLSAYLRHGVLTLAGVRRHLLHKHRNLDRFLKFVQELAWRDYWQRVYAAEPDSIWHSAESLKTGRPESHYAAQLPADIQNANTGLACMDAFVTELKTTGYLHNHARMWFAAYVVHFCRIRWQAGAAFFLSHLLDGDPASNNLSWQWVASTFSSKPYIFNKENLEHYSSGTLCANCPSRKQCPFDATYEDLSERLFPHV